MMYKVIKKFGVQNLDSTLSWYDVGETVDKDVIKRLSTHALSGLVEAIKDKKPRRKRTSK
mgnify:CR=1 FL=1